MEIKTDFLVLGSGIAGLSFAIKAARLGRVAVVTKKDACESNTNYAQGGIATVFDPGDSFENHINDTLTCGAGLSRPDVADFVVREGPERIMDLVEWGVNFSRAEGGQTFDLAQEGGHSRRRVLHAQDLTGREIERVLNERAARDGNISIYENFVAVDLITIHPAGHKSRATCLGAYILDDKSNEIHTFLASYIIIATGGTGKVYQVTSNPDIATGDGIAMAYRAGADIANMEFIQFHPTCLYHPEAKAFLISEALRGEGGILRLKNGEPFMDKYHPLGCLAPRDIVARALDSEMKRTGDEYVLLDMTHLPGRLVVNRFPNIFERCRQFGFDLTCDPLPVVPAAHYICGGIAVDAWGETTIERLFALGEAACTGLHGANRLASNSLLEALVFAHRAVQKIARVFAPNDRPFSAVRPWNLSGVTQSEELILIAHNWHELRQVMSNYVGIVRSNQRLQMAWRRIDLIEGEVTDFYRKFYLNRDLVELRNIALVARLIVQGAMSRRESRGLHTNLDYPGRDDANFQKDTLLRRGMNRPV
jgi:L-aspartate oxidase